MGSAFEKVTVNVSFSWEKKEIMLFYLSDFQNSQLKSKVLIIPYSPPLTGFWFDSPILLKDYARRTYQCNWAASSR